ncbi:MAG: hypothetical protein MPK34_09315 [Gammaproteobacteria bacterium]|nr:hypothetical protein [Gammaproteobacteria bacterium]
MKNPMKNPVKTPALFLKWKLAAAALFLIAAGLLPSRPAFAQSATHTIAYAAVGSTTPLLTFDASAITPASDGTRVFKLDIIGKTSIKSSHLFVWAHIIPEELEIINIENIASASSRPGPGANAGRLLHSVKRTVNGVAYEKAHGWSWSGTSLPIFRFHAFFHANRYARLMTVTLKLKTFEGDTTANFSKMPGGRADTVVAGNQLIVRLPASPLVVSSLTETIGENLPARQIAMKLGAQPASGNVVVNLSSSDPGEATVSPAVLNYTSANWEQEQTITVAGVDDNFDDGDKPFTLTLAVDNAKTSDTYYHSAGKRITGVNTDDDTAQLSVSVSPQFLTEDAPGAQQVTFTADLAGDVRLEGDMRVALAFKTGSGAGTATSGTDYTAFTPPTITIQSGEATGAATANITTTDDGPGDSDETIVLTATLAPYTLNDLTLPIREFALTPSKTSVSVTEGGAETFTLALPTRPASGNVIVDVASSNAGEAAAAPAALTFAAGNFGAPQTVTVTGMNNNFDDGDRTYTLTLAVDAAKTADANYHGREARIESLIIDDDTAEITLRATPEFLVESAGAQPITVTAALGGEIRLEQDAVITLALGSGGATAGTDYQAFTLPPTITIPARAAAGIATFAVTPMDDTDLDSDENIVITAAFSPYTIANLDLEILGFELDVDASGAVTPQDGIMTARRLLGVLGASLVAAQSAADASAVAANIDLGSRTRELDVNADGAVNAADGILITRWLLGLRGDELVAGFADASAAVVRDNMAKFGR